ncbi:MAG: hypothetical protein QHH75_07700 [Bacillota bacterium]|nr:hypothetical protein [Bacillota bacterium]
MENWIERLIRQENMKILPIEKKTLQNLFILMHLSLSSSYLAHGYKLHWRKNLTAGFRSKPGCFHPNLFKTLAQG